MTLTAKRTFRLEDGMVPDGQLRDDWNDWLYGFDLI
jgi:hypothetical protein